MKAPNPKHLVFWLLVIVIVFAAILIATELFLKISSNALSPHHFNYAFSRYDTGPGGIYYTEPITGMKFMRPSTLSRIGYNGYLWTHNTDSNGFRNISADTSKKTLLLGDSLIYGHGVDPEETVVSHLNRDYNQQTYNMARQGDTIFQQYVLLRLFNDDFQPAAAILFFFAMTRPGPKYIFLPVKGHVEGEPRRE